MLRQRDETSDASGAAAFAPEEEGPAGSRNGGWRGASKWGWQGMAERDAPHDRDGRPWLRPAPLPVRPLTVRQGVTLPEWATLFPVSNCSLLDQDPPPDTDRGGGSAPRT